MPGEDKPMLVPVMDKYKDNLFIALIVISIVIQSVLAYFLILKHHTLTYGKLKDKNQIIELVNEKNILFQFLIYFSMVILLASMFGPRPITPVIKVFFG